VSLPQLLNYQKCLILSLPQVALAIGTDIKRDIYLISIVWRHFGLRCAQGKMSLLRTVWIIIVREFADPLAAAHG
jgi:hypothetical protein